MALSNSQYDHLMRTYEQKQLDNEFQLRKRYEKAYALIPELEEVDHSISSLSVKKARLLLDGDQTALSSLKSELKELSARMPHSVSISDIQPLSRDTICVCIICRPPFALSLSSALAAASILESTSVLT